MKIKNALISVSDKSGLDKILRTLKKFGVNFVSSGGTYKKKNHWDICVQKFQSIRISRNFGWKS